MADKPWAAAEDLAGVDIVAGTKSSASERLAAEELQTYWKAVFGVEPTLSGEASQGPLIFIGFEGAPAEVLAGIDPAAFAPQELIIRTFEKDGQPQLLIAGGTEDGTLYGVYQFIEDYLGVRWLAPGATHIPEAPASIPAIDFRYCPVFDYRYSDYLKRIGDLEKRESYMRAHRWRHGPGFMCHSYYRYVPPEEHFDAHPEWYSLVRGKRLAPRFNWHEHQQTANWHTEFGQLCMTNTEMLDCVKQRIDADIAEDPEKKIHHLSQMDWYNWCECPDCAALDEQEGTHMGSVLWGLNYLAEWLEAAHPGHLLETLAYQWTRTPPKHMKPRPNVAIKLCSIECDFSRPLSDPDSPENRKFAEDLKAWSAIAPRLHCWDYVTDFACAQTPLPNFHVMQPNAQFLAAHNAKAYFPEGWFDLAAEFAALKAYLASKVMWNPDVDLQAAKEEFLRLYYEEAAPHVRAYIDLVTAAQQAHGQALSCFDKGHWYTATVVEKARAIMAGAFDAADTPEIRQRVEQVNVTVEWAALCCAPEVKSSSSAISVTRPDSLTMEEYEAMLVRLGGTQNTVFKGTVDGFRQLIANTTPPRRLESPILPIENERYVVWAAPLLEGSILRMYDKKLDAELLKGYEVYGRRGGSWQDWVDTPSQFEHPVAMEYQVVQQAGHALVFEAKLVSGIRVHRTMRLDPGADSFDVRLTLTNEADRPQPGGVKIHPEFFLPAGHAVELYGLRQGKWEHLNPGGESMTVFFEPVYERLAYYVPKLDITTFVEVGDSVGGLLCYYTAYDQGQHMNLDLRPPQRDLAPGESLTFGGKYGSVQGPLHSA